MKKNDIIKVECSDLSHQGLGVCKVAGFPLFVQGLLIGEVGEVKITEIKKNFGFAKLLNLIKKSNDRVEAICPIFAECGGCDIMHLNYNAGLEFKRKNAIETLKRIGKIDFPIKNIICMDNPYYYRNTVQIPYQLKNDRVVYGFYKKGTHEVVPFEKCYIQTQSSTNIALYIQEFINGYLAANADKKINAQALRHVVIRNTQVLDYMVILVTKFEVVPYLNNLITKIKEEFPNVKSIYQNINPKNTNLVLGEKNILLFGSKILKEKILNLEFTLSPQSFFQTNHLQTEKLYSKVLEYLEPSKEDIIVDAYCGVGTISLLLARSAKYVYGIDIVRSAINDARENAHANNLNNVRFIVGRVEEELLPKKNIDKIVLDPPRKGCDRLVLETIIKKEIKRIVYVSCNMATLARDLNILSSAYKIKDITLYDMFPHSNHVEVCVLLELR